MKTVVILLFLACFCLSEKKALAAFPSSDDYGSLSGKVTPAPDTTGVYEDTVLTITFDDTPTLGSGQVQIFDASNKSVDTIKLTSETNTYGSRSNLNVGGQLIYTNGKNVVITPHHGKLAANTKYHVAIETTVVKGTLNGHTFNGFSTSTQSWHFTTRAAHSASGSTVAVAPSGTADFRSIQGGLNAASSGSGAVTISISAGSYHEALDWRSTRVLTLQGTGKANTDVQIAFENCEGMNSGTDGRPLFLIKNNDAKVKLENLQMENTHVKGSTGGQAEVLYFGGSSSSSSCYFSATNCRFISRQDTLQLHGYAFFYDCYISGDVDYIWGANNLALFEKCRLNARTDNRGASSVSYTLQARTLNGKKGFVFLDCNFTADSDRTGTVWIARTNGAGTSSSTDGWDSIAVVKSRVDTAKYNAAFWMDDGTKKVYPTKGSVNAGTREYGNTDTKGSALSTSSRHSANYVMTKAEFNANYASRSKIVSGTPLASVVGDGQSYAE